METRSLQFLKSLLDTPGPSGFEAAPARVWRKEAESFAESVTADVGGNSLATVNPAGTPRIMFAGHIDEIGVMVVHIDDEGFLHFDTVGGWDHQVFVGQRVILLGRQGPVPGVIGKKAIHLMEKEDREKVSKASDLWIDIGAMNRAEAEARVRVADERREARLRIVLEEGLEPPGGSLEIEPHVACLSRPGRAATSARAYARAARLRRRAAPRRGGARPRARGSPRWRARGGA